MPSSSSPARVLAGPFLSVALLLAACGSAEPETLSCETEAECPPLSRCISRGCVANSAPVAAVVLPSGELQANLLHSFDASASADPDEGDAVVSFAWTLRSLDAACEPPVVAGTGPVAKVRFACPGRYAVDLAAADAMGAVGRRVVELVVAPYTGPALVTAGPDVASHHSCTASPLRCAPENAVSLSASAPAFPPGELSFEWSVEPPPNRPLDGSRRVTFQPGPGAAAPGVVIETDGTSISGEWVFHVVARDAAGVIGSAATIVSVGNRPPRINDVAPPVVHHRFVSDAQGARFTASGELAVVVTDPDGDLLVQRTAQWRHTGAGPGAVFEGEDLQSKLTFSVVVPYATPSDASHLIGGPGLERFVELAVSDVNGARASAAWNVTISNRPPVHVSAPAPSSVGHFYDPASLSYRAVASLSYWSDPDGDPLFAEPGGPGLDPDGDPLCSVAVSDAGIARAECALAFLGVPAVHLFAGTRTVTQRIRDPWTAASTPVSASFTIGNNPPVISSTATHVAGALCEETGPCCQGPASECTRFWSSAYAGSSTVPPRWSDPDGDPLSIQVAPSGAVTPVQPLVCTPATCSLRLDLRAANVCGSTTTSHSTVITDGLASASGTLTVERRCP